jgi:RHS repeat-associated protein
MASACSNWPQADLPGSFIVSLAGACCRCGTKADPSACGSCDESDDCANCGSFNGYFALTRDEKNSCHFTYSFPLVESTGKTPCSAESLDLWLTNHSDPTRVNVCLQVNFSDADLRPVSWGKTAVTVGAPIGVLRRRTTTSQCCWPDRVTVTPVPTPDLAPPQPEWLRGDPDDLIDAPFWPTLDIDPLDDGDFAPVRYFNGELQLRSKDVASNGFGIPWGHTRIYSNRLSNSFDFGNGFNWLVLEWPRLVLLKSDTTGGKTGCTVVWLRGTRNAIWFDEFTDGSNPTYWRARYGAKHQLQYFAKEKLFRIATANGHVWEFYDFTSPFSKANSNLSSSDRAKIATGRFKRHIGPGGQTATATWNNCQLQNVVRTGPEGTLPGTETITYQYLPDDDPNAGRLQFVTIVGALGNVGRAVYAYYEEDDDNGNLGDLMTVDSQFWDLNLNDWNSRPDALTYYRYYTQPLDSYTQGLLKFVIGPEAFYRLTLAGIDTMEAEDEELAAYADIYLGPTLDEAYDDNRRITQIIMDGGERTHEFEYDLIELNSVDVTEVAIVATESRPDGTMKVVASNYVGQVLNSTLFDTTPGVANVYIESRAYDPDHFGLTTIYTPSSNRMARAGGVVYQLGYQSFTPQQGYVNLVSIQNGQAAAAVPLKAFTYDQQYLAVPSLNEPFAPAFSVRAVDSIMTFGVATPTAVPSPQDGFIGIAYTWFGATGQMSSRTISLAAVQDAQTNDPDPEQGQPLLGPPLTLVSVESFDLFGNLENLVDARGALTTVQWVQATGAPQQSSLTYDDGKGGLTTIVTDFLSDALGRVTRILGPWHNAVVDTFGVFQAQLVRRATWIVHQDLLGETWVGHGYQSDGDNLINPVDIERYDRAGRTTDVIRAVRAFGSGELLATDVFPQPSWVAREERLFDDENRLYAVRQYTDAEFGVYNETLLDYDPMYRVYELTSPSGTLMQFNRDGRGLVLNTLVGTDETNLEIVEQNEYDNPASFDNPAQSQGGNGTLSAVTQFVNQTTQRRTQFISNWRDQRVGMLDATGRPFVITNTNQDQTAGVLQIAGTNPIVADVSGIDNRGRPYQTFHLAWNQSPFTPLPPLVDTTIYDDANDVIELHPHGGTAFIRYTRDGLGRAVYTDLIVPSVGGEVLVERVETSFDPAGNPIKQLTTTNANTSEQITWSRLSGIAGWFDPLGRQVATADFGINLSPAIDAPDVPMPSDLVLVTTTSINERGEPQIIIDPSGRTLWRAFDDAGQMTWQIENYVTGTVPSPVPDQDRAISLVYSPEGDLGEVQVFNPATGGPAQITTLFYGTETTAVGVATGHLLSRIVYPDGGEVALAYNRQGEVVAMTPPDGVTHTYELDLLGRRTDDTVSGSVNGPVRNIHFGYNQLGMLDLAVSDDGMGTEINRVARVHNPRGQILREYQFHRGIQNEIQAPFVAYNYADGSANHVRLRALQYPGRSVTWPNGRVAQFLYGPMSIPGFATSNDISDPLNRLLNDGLSRVSSIQAAFKSSLGGIVQLPVGALYRYWGAGNFYGVQLPEPSIVSDLTTGPISGLDNFDRATTSSWLQGTTLTPVASLAYSYYRNGMRAARGNFVAPNHSEVYGYDRLDRLNSLIRGQLSPTGAFLPGTKTFAQQWLLDATDNWSLFQQDSTGNGQWAVQQRWHNGANEITRIQGQNWPTPIYDANGNPTSNVPQVLVPSAGFRFDVDPWNRVVGVRNQAGALIAQMQYDALSRRTIKSASGQTRHFYYSSDWQMLDERLEVPGVELFSIPPEREYVWGVRGPDDLILRERSTANNGVLDERLYAVQDLNFNVVAIVNASGAAQERYEFDAYGVTTFENASTFQSLSPNQSAVAWNVLYGGYYFDPETGLYLARNRFYHPGLGRWLQRDPMGYADSANLYQYGLSDPASVIDPEGLIIESPWDIFSIGVGIGSTGLDIYQIAKTGEGWADLGMDVFGLGVDVLAALVPGVPGGASVALRASRALRVANAAVKYGRRADLALNLFQSGRYGVEAYRQGDPLGVGLALLGAGLSSTHVLVRAQQFNRNLLDQARTRVFVHLTEEQYTDIVKKGRIGGHTGFLSEGRIWATPYTRAQLQGPLGILRRRSIGIDPFVGITRTIEITDEAAAAFSRPFGFGFSRNPIGWTKGILGNQFQLRASLPYSGGRVIRDLTGAVYPTRVQLALYRAQEHALFLAWAGSGALAAKSVYEYVYGD